MVKTVMMCRLYHASLALLPPELLFVIFDLAMA
jgi:hypothetical protein